MKVRIDVMLKEGVLDPQGKAIGHALGTLGFSGVDEVRVGKTILVTTQETDPAKARDLVKKTSYNGQPLRWHITRQFYPNYEAAAEIMAEQWREIGVNVQPIVLDNFDLVYRRPFHMMNMSMATDFIPGVSNVKDAYQAGIEADLQKCFGFFQLDD